MLSIPMRSLLGTTTRNGDVGIPAYRHGYLVERRDIDLLGAQLVLDQSSETFQEESLAGILHRSVVSAPPLAVWHS